MMSEARKWLENKLYVDDEIKNDGDDGKRDKGSKFK